MKETLKKYVLKKQGGACALSGVALPEDMSLVDVDRITPRTLGGTYDQEENVRVLDPREHMKHHGILRDRPAQMEALKSIFDDRVQTMRLMLKVNNQILAYDRRTDNRNEDTSAWLQEQVKPFQSRLGTIDSALSDLIQAYDDPVVRAALAVPGIGLITVAALTVYVDIKKAESPSSLWKYVGIHCPSGERYTKGEAGGGNKTLRTVLWNTANTLMKMRSSPYRQVYDAAKLRLSISEKIVASRNTEGKLVNVAWKDAKPSHRHGAALRAIMKHLLVDYWLTGRAIKGLSTKTIYAEGMLVHTHIIPPEERGWIVP